MDIARRLGIFQPVLFGSTYERKVKNLFGSALLAYWPLWENSGSTAHDISGNDRDGSYSGVALGEQGIGDGHTCPFFDGASGYCNVYSTDLRDAFNGSEGTAMIWAKPGVGALTDGAAHDFVRLQVDTANRVCIQKTATHNNFALWWEGADALEIVSLTVSTYVWHHFAITWSKSADQVKVYVDGAQSGSTQTGLNTWTGNLALAILGASSSAPAFPWNGWLAHALLLDRAASAMEVAKCATV